MEQAAETVRLFFALWPDSAMQAKLAAWAKQAAGRGRAMRQENIHLTLAFLGATDVSHVPDLIALHYDRRREDGLGGVSHFANQDATGDGHRRQVEGWAE